MDVLTAVLAFVTKHAFARKDLSVTSNDKAFTRSIGAASGLPRANKRPKRENTKIQKGRILDAGPFAGA